MPGENIWTLLIANRNQSLKIETLHQWHVKRSLFWDKEDSSLNYQDLGGDDIACENREDSYIIKNQPNKNIVDPKWFYIIVHLVF